MQQLDDVRTEVVTRTAIRIGSALIGLVAVTVATPILWGLELLLGGPVARRVRSTLELEFESLLSTAPVAAPPPVGGEGLTRSSGASPATRSSSAC